MQVAQSKLSGEQVAAFYHSAFVADQIQHFRALLGSSARQDVSSGRGVVTDVGGGVGFFAEGLRDSLGVAVRVVDMDPLSVAKCRERGIDADQADALGMKPVGDESVVCFNLILHHLVGKDVHSTRTLQLRALSAWRDAGVKLFVNEYIYESFVAGWSGSLIYRITSSNMLSALAGAVSRIVPSLRANTFGVGVRFRGEAEWVGLFREAGFEVVGRKAGDEEHVDLPLRALLIRSIKRSSFLLVPAKA
jgi:hypothetical protein